MYSLEEKSRRDFACTWRAIDANNFNAAIAQDVSFDSSFTTTVL